METTDRINAILGLQKVRLERFKQSKDIEFKLNIALWTMIVIAGFYLKGEIHLAKCCEFAIYIGASLVITACHRWLRLRFVSNSQADDFSRILRYQTRVHKLMDEPDLDPDHPEEMTKEKLQNHYIKWNNVLAGITFFLLILLGIVFTIVPLSHSTCGH